MNVVTSAHTLIALQTEYGVISVKIKDIEMLFARFEVATENSDIASGYWLCAKILCDDGHNSRIYRLLNGTEDECSTELLRLSKMINSLL